MIHNPKEPNQPSCPPWELLLEFTVQAEKKMRRQRKSLGERIDQCEHCADLSTRPDRHEPRARKRRPKKYDLLNKPREVLRRTPLCEA